MDEKRSKLTRTFHILSCQYTSYLWWPIFMRLSASKVHSDFSLNNFWVANPYHKPFPNPSSFAFLLFRENWRFLLYVCRISRIILCRIGKDSLKIAVQRIDILKNFLEISRTEQRRTLAYNNRAKLPILVLFLF